MLHTIWASITHASIEIHIIWCHLNGDGNQNYINAVCRNVERFDTFTRANHIKLLEARYILLVEEGSNSVETLNIGDV